MALSLRRVFRLTAVICLICVTNARASDAIIEEVIVTARQQAETLQDVPVTIAAMTEEDLGV